MQFNISQRGRRRRRVFSAIKNKGVRVDNALYLQARKNRNSK